jgi:hypothetical protein
MKCNSFLRGNEFGTTLTFAAGPDWIALISDDNPLLIFH